MKNFTEQYQNGILSKTLNTRLKMKMMIDLKWKCSPQVKMKWYEISVWNILSEVQIYGIIGKMVQTPWN